MLVHKDPEVQFIIETLERQRDQAVTECAVHFKDKIDLINKIKELEKIINEEDSDKVLQLNKKGK